MDTARQRSHPVSLEEFLDLLSIEELDRDLYRARNPEPAGRPVLYGGHVAAQALQAAARTIPDGRLPHSLHGYFLRPGQVDRPTILRVNRDRDGNSFSARHVVALQDAQVILSMSVSFHREEDGVEHEARTPPDVPGPGALLSADPRGVLGEWMGIFEFRLTTPEQVPPPTTRWAAPTRMWSRTTGPIGQDRVLHACVLTYISDLSSGFGDLGLPIDPPSGGPSLDHALWLHRPLNVEEWFFLDLEPLITAGSRGLYHGAIYDHQRRRCASISQEMLTRTPRLP
jgi:acyl-CoA thioesterase-2